MVLLIVTPHNNSQLERSLIDLTIGQPDLGSFSTEFLSSQMTIGFVKLTIKINQHSEY